MSVFGIDFGTTTSAAVKLAEHAEPQRYGDFESRWDGARLTITPDPFDGATIPMRVSARRLPNTRFDARTACAAFADAPVGTIAGVAAGAGRS